MVALFMGCRGNGRNGYVMICLYPGLGGTLFPKKHMVVMVVPAIKTPGDATRVPYPGEGRGDLWPVLQILVRQCLHLKSIDIHN